MTDTRRELASSQAASDDGNSNNNSSGSTRVLVVDDERPARMRLRALVEDLVGYQVVAEADGGEQALALCETQQPDIVLMDIRMPGVDGLQAASRMALQENPPAVIFCTAYDEHALAAFEANAVGYLTKPIKSAHLQDALKKAGALNRAQLTKVEASLEGGGATAVDGRSRESDFLLAKTSRGEERIFISEIRALVADSKYVSAYIEGREVLLDQSLKALEADYADCFVRVHRNALVAPAFILALEKVDPSKEHAQLQVKLKGSDAAPLVSRRLAPAIRKLIREH